MTPKQILPKFYAFLNGPLNNYIYYIDDDIKIQIDASFDTMKPVDILILTHFHWDHIQAVNEIKRRTPCKVWATRETADNIKNTNLFWITKTNFEVDKILEDEEEIKTENFAFKVIKTPGHASGALCLYDEEKKILITGDTWFKEGLYGRTDLPTGNTTELQESIKKLKKLKVKYLCPAHQY
jgi:glyoxylase-like metal-dependent hydrolase (beta-lactamase superfamily II)